MRTDHRQHWYHKRNPVEKENTDWTDHALVILFFVFLVSIGLLTS